MINRKEETEKIKERQIQGGEIFSSTCKTGIGVIKIRFKNIIQIDNPHMIFLAICMKNISF